MPDEHPDEPAYSLPRDADNLPAGTRSQEELIAYRRKFAPPRRELTDAERKFLDRYLADDRVVGVRFGKSKVEVQVVRDDGKLDLPETFGGRPVAVRAFPETDPAARDRDGGGDNPPGPLAEFL